ncbi:NAD(+) diphosphatase [Micromonospora echinofusca]|uniref:NAD(+) diphosphatase n=1 Tax=Micromonospora echinofusca TaxID=47858 RepID=A0ABS3VQR9_MICEH|nr:NAD(+) diphosphatase [Micromonospora echinofusca]MBO4206856.1 NAD(+) diphosphatase [Micromonospora echinofusca]
MTDAAPPLARSTLDRAAHHRTDPAWLAGAWSRGRALVVDVAAGGRALVRDADTPALVLLPTAEAPSVPEAARLFLGVEPDDVPVFAVVAELPEVTGARAAGLREVGHLLTDRDAGLLTTAVALANWHAGHGYSPVTGRPTRIDEGGWSRVDDTGHRIWPRTDPAMIVLVHDGVGGPAGRCLLGSNAAWPGQPGRRRFSCLAGYVEPGESAEAAVVREVAEEVGVPVDRVEYVASQSWPFPGSLMLGFRAVADPAWPVRLDPTEISHALWFSRREIGRALAGEPVPVDDTTALALPPPLSIAFHLIRHWLECDD